MNESAPTTFFEELKRRHVVRVAVVYVATAFAALQGADVLVSSLELPDQTMKFLTVGMMVGLPIALVLAWAYEINREGLRRTVQDVGASRKPAHAGTKDDSWISPKTIAAAAALLLIGGAIGWLTRPAVPVGPTTAAGANWSALVALPAQVFAPEEEAYLADAIPNTLTTHLSQVADLEVRVPPSSIEFSAIGGDLGRLAEAYGVGGMILTSITAESGRFVLNVQLVEARTRNLIWSNQFSGPRGQYLELARSAADGIRAAVRPEAEVVALSQQTAASAEAELAFEKGRHAALRYIHDIRPGDFEAGMRFLEQSLVLDPGLSRAASWISRMYLARWEFADNEPEILAQIERWARTALELDPANGEAITSLAFHSLYTNPEASRPALEYAMQGVALEPQSGFALNGLGVTLEPYSTRLTLAAWQIARRVEPLFVYPAVNMALPLRSLNRLEEASASLEDALRLQPELPFALALNALLLADLGQTDAAAEGLDRIDAGDTPILDVIARFGVPFSSAYHTGNQAEIERLRTRAIDITQNLSAPYFTRTFTARIALETVRQHESLEQTLAFADQVSASLDYSREWLIALMDGKIDPSDPRLQRILTHHQSRQAELSEILDSARATGQIPDFLAGISE